MLLVARFNLIFIVNRTLTTRPATRSRPRASSDQFRYLTNAPAACVEQPRRAVFGLHFRDLGMFSREEASPPSDGVIMIHIMEQAMSSR
jgi:hypothetical protein